MYGQPTPPAYRIETERLVVRCWEPADAPRLKAAIDASLAHLLPWMPWARDEPQSVDTKMELLRQFRGRFDLGKDLVYGIFDRRDEREVVGGTGLHPRHEKHYPKVREIGYWVAEKHAGHGYATEAAAALVRIGFELEKLELVEIHCEEENEKSAAVARKLGFTEDALLRQRVARRDGSLAARRAFSLFATEYSGSPCARARVEAFDALGRKCVELPPPNARPRSAFR
jgi:RimJ/RimL family protein N-acetyltransferase